MVIGIMLMIMIMIMMMKVINDSSAKYAQMKVSLTFTRRWFYHGVNVFLQE